MVTVDENGNNVDPWFPGAVVAMQTHYPDGHPLRIPEEQVEALQAQEALGAILTALTGQRISQGGAALAGENIDLPALNYRIAQEAAIALGVVTALELTPEQREQARQQHNFMENPCAYPEAIQRFVYSYAANSIAPKLDMIRRYCEEHEPQVMAEKLAEILTALPEGTLRPEYIAAGKKLAAQMAESGSDAALLVAANQFVRETLQKNLLKDVTLAGDIAFLQNIPELSSVVPLAQQAIEQGALVAWSQQLSRQITGGLYTSYLGDLERADTQALAAMVTTAAQNAAALSTAAPLRKVVSTVAQ